ncbi:MAG: antibiotic biosynthesis monooxygenase [Thermoproteota archaeon]|nr:antibiotic biosynthesis monooxygenase [Thermoproteota archaeon]
MAANGILVTSKIYNILEFNEIYGKYYRTSTIEHDGKVTTIINVFTVQPKDQQHLIDLLIDATEKVTSQQEGFISVNIHKSLDGTRVVNYEQWKSKEAFEKMLKNPRAITYQNDVLSVAKLDGSLYRVVFVNTSTKQKH